MDDDWGYPHFGKPPFGTSLLPAARNNGRASRRRSRALSLGPGRWTWANHFSRYTCDVKISRWLQGDFMPRIMLVGGWAYPSEKYDFVSWDDDIPNWMESHKIHVPNHQPDENEQLEKGDWLKQVSQKPEVLTIVEIDYVGTVPISQILCKKWQILSWWVSR